jgi:(2Fe-2S) ferredoxin
VTRFRRHIFVCTNGRPGGGRPACGPRGGEALRAALERAIAANPELCGQVAVTACACLGPCFDGPNLVVYPDGVWYAGAAAADAEAIVAEHLLAGRPLERLVYRWPDDDD